MPTRFGRTLGLVNVQIADDAIANFGSCLLLCTGFCHWILSAARYGPSSPDGVMTLSDWRQKAIEALSCAAYEGLLTSCAGDKKSCA